MNIPMPTENRQRLVWVDALRFAAIFLVILSHSCDPLTANPDPAVSSDPSLGFWGACWQSLTRPSVPLFVCMTGLLLLPVREDMFTFWSRRCRRVLWPFLIWSVLYCLYPVIGMGLGMAPETVTRCFVAVETPSPALCDALQNIARIPFDFTPYAVHMWYIFLVLGLYLYLPVFSAWVAKATRREKLAVLGIWFLSLFLPYAAIVTPQCLGTCAWNHFGMLYYFAGFSGYLLLGHLIATAPAPSFRRALGIGLTLIIIGYAITLIGFRITQTLPQDAADWELGRLICHACSPTAIAAPYTELHETCLMYCSPNVALMTLGVLLIFRSLPAAHFSPALQAALRNLTACGLGIYLVHYLIIGPANILVQDAKVPIPLQVPLSALITIAVVWPCVALLRRLLRRHAAIVLG